MQPATPQFLLTEDFQPYRQKVALVVGIDRYAGAIRDLNFAAADAIAVAHLLRDDLSFDKVVLLLNEKASREHILRALVDLKEGMDQDDQVLFYFAGHGVAFTTGGRGFGYLVPQDAKGVDEGTLASSGISMNRVREHLDLLPAKHVLMIVDSCFSGFAAPSTRSLTPATSPYLRNITTSRARQIITAGKRDEEVEEKHEWGHSALTRELLRGFQTRAADPDENGIIIAAELFVFLSSAVSDLTEGRQNPQFVDLGSDEGEFAFILPPPSTTTGIASSIPRQDLDQIPKAENSRRPEERLVTSVERDASGELTAFCDPGSPWSPRSKEEVVDDIESGRMRYYVDWEEGKRTLIHVVTDRRGQYLRTDRDRTELNNLNSLPDCGDPPDR